MRERATSVLSGIASAILGVLALVFVVGITAVCQLGQGEIRPYLPEFARSLVLSPENNADVDEYLREIDDIIVRLFKETEECSDAQDQNCLTAATERAYNDVDEGLPASASWMSDEHGDLTRALREIWQVNLLSESAPLDDALLQRSIAAGDELTEAIERWYDEAERGQ